MDMIEEVYSCFSLQRRSDKRLMVSDCFRRHRRLPEYILCDVGMTFHQTSCGPCCGSLVEYHFIPPVLDVDDEFHLPRRVTNHDITITVRLAVNIMDHRTFKLSGTGCAEPAGHGIGFVHLLHGHRTCGEAGICAFNLTSRL